MFKYQFIGICPGIDFSQYFNNISDYVFKVSPGAEKIVLITKCIGTKKLHPFAKSLIYKKKKAYVPVWATWESHISSLTVQTHARYTQRIVDNLTSGLSPGHTVPIWRPRSLRSKKSWRTAWSAQEVVATSY